MIAISDDKSNYPLIIVSHQLRDTLKKEIPLQLEEPIKPSYPYRNNDGPWGCLIVSAIFLVIILLSGSVSFETLGGLAALLLVSISVYWINISMNKNRIYRQSIIEYEANLRVYEAKKAEFDFHKLTVREQAKTRIFRLNLVKEMVSKSRLPE